MTNVILGYNLKDIIQEDKKIIQTVKEGYDNIPIPEENEVKRFEGLDISVLNCYVDTVGTVYHGVKITAPCQTDLDSIGDMLHLIITSIYDISKIHIWHEEKEDGMCEIFVECEDVIINTIEEQGIVRNMEEISKLYNLHK